jgi:hypothetical protein
MNELEKLTTQRQLEKALDLLDAALNSQTLSRDDEEQVSRARRLLQAVESALYHEITR